MELIVGEAETKSEGAIEPGRAFLAGMLSMVDALLGRPSEYLVQEFCLSDEVARALTHHEGALGGL